jgi:hypothetical protein
MPFFTAWTDILRLSIPVLGSLAMLALRDAYAYPEAPLRRNVLLDTAAAFGAFLTQALLDAVMPALALPRPIRVQGGLVSILALLLVRLNKPEPQITTVVAGPQSGDALLEEARKFEMRIRRRNLREYGGAAIVVFGFGRILWIGPQPLIRLGAALILAATAFVVYRIHTRGAAQPVPADARAARAVHRRAMEQQRDLLKSIWRWYLLPFVPGFVVLNIGTAIRNGVLFNQNATPEQLARGITTLFFTVTLFFIVPFLLMIMLMAELNKRGASRLQQKIEALDATEHTSGE